MIFRPKPTKVELAAEWHEHGLVLLADAHDALEEAYHLTQEAAAEHNDAAKHHLDRAAAALSHGITIEDRRRRVVDALPTEAK